ncbi:MAG: flagellar hook-associated protein 3 [Desulfobacteraceae bacterium 4572_130]|nr:MAG: flagellar hook-associated protein 3 [Desulfobacteraceae bacterium 4572_130]
MRISTMTLYDTSKFQLGNLTSNLARANTIMSTQKRINTLSDDPVGLTQVLDLKASINCIEQIDKDIEVGRTWLVGCETALNNINDQILEAKLLSLQMANASVSTTNRVDAAKTVQKIIDQVKSLGNTQINGNYIFAGTKTDLIPFTYNDDNEPSEVIYNGDNSSFKIKTDKYSTLKVGRDGQEIFNEEKIKIDTTNNIIVFKEDIGKGKNSEITIKAEVPSGTYTHDELAVVVRNTMNFASNQSGNKIKYNVTYDKDQQKFEIQDNGTPHGYFRFDLLWDTGESSRIIDVTTTGIIKDDVNIDIINATALIHETPEPSGTAQLGFMWNEQKSTWTVFNDPGFDLPFEISGTSTKIELDITGNGISDIVINLDTPVEDDNTIAFDIVAGSNDHSIGPELGFSSTDIFSIPPTSDTKVPIISINNTNNILDFEETTITGNSTTCAAVIPNGNYSNMDEFASAIEKAMELKSANNINYSVKYSKTNQKFIIKESGSELNELNLLWLGGVNNTRTQNLGKILGYDITTNNTGVTSHISDSKVILFNITADNNKINFKELLDGESPDAVSELTADIPAKEYSTAAELATAIEKAMEEKSQTQGNNINYNVSYNDITNKFTIKQDSNNQKKLDELKLLWKSGLNSDTNCAQVIGFDLEDEYLKAPQGKKVSWGVFNTLFDLKKALETDDIDGITRAMTRLDTHYESILSDTSDTGIKYNRIETKKQIMAEAKLSFTQRRSEIEDADIVAGILNLEAIKTAYNAALNSTAKIMNLSLVNYI